MDEGTTVALEFTEDELERILMCLTLARNSPYVSERLEVDDLIERFTDHADGTAVTGVEDRLEGPGDD